MALTDLWLTSPDQLRQKQIQQLIAFAGDGRLRDGSAAAQEFRDFLSGIPSEYLSRYAHECLTTSFTESGVALQDVVNEMGRRLGFQTTFGRYRGKSGEIGFDGLWRSPSGHALVVEVKTTDAYRIDLNTIAGYRRALVGLSQIDETESSILIIVGRQDTGDLEAQIRGSRHAWDIRLISIDALVRLLSVKEDVEDPETLSRVHQVLVPMEFTRLDQIVDILFSTAEDLKETEQPAESDENQERLGKKFTPVAFHRACVDRIAATLNLRFVKQSRASFHTPAHEVHLICAVSREHERSGHPAYWFAFQPHQQAFLAEAETAFVAFGCGSPEHVLLVPFERFLPWLEGLNVTEKPNRSYWHVPIVKSGSKFTLLRRKDHRNVDLTGFLLPLA